MKKLQDKKIELEEAKNNTEFKFHQEMAKHATRYANQTVKLEKETEEMKLMIKVILFS